MPGESQNAGPANALSTGAATAATGQKQSLARRWLAAFGRFWWDFLVGDTPELLIGALIILGIVALLVKWASLNAVAVAAFPVMVAVLLGISVYRARPKR